MSKLEPQIQKAVDELIKCINQSEAYVEYKELRDRVNQNQEEYDLVRKSQEIRRRLFEIPESEINSDYAEHLQEEYANLCDNTIVYRHEHAEIKLGEVLREVLGEIISLMEYE